MAPTLESPQDNAVGVSIRPLFQWSAVAGAGGYELMVSSKSDFSNPEINRIDEYALPTNAWQSDIDLFYDTKYYWKARAVSSSTNSAWSTVGSFTTELEPAGVAEPPTTTLSNPEAPEISQVITVVPPPDIIVEPPVVSVEPTVVTAEAPDITMELQIPTQPTPQPTTNPSLQRLYQNPSATPDWIYYVVGGMSVITILLLITLLVLVLKQR